MANPIKRVHDLSTNEVTDTEMTDAEYAAFLAANEAAAQSTPIDTGDE
jgi:hypothetical protein